MKRIEVDTADRIPPPPLSDLYPSRTMDALIFLNRVLIHYFSLLHPLNNNNNNYVHAAWDQQCLVGRASVGKSSLVVRWVNNTFIDFEDPTVGNVIVLENNS